MTELRIGTSNLDSEWNGSTMHDVENPHLYSNIPGVLFSYLGQVVRPYLPKLPRTSNLEFTSTLAFLSNHLQQVH